MRTSERGSAIILLFVMVALFGLISYAFLQNSRGGMNWIKGEQSKAETTNSQDCSNAVNMAARRLDARGCSGLISYHGDGTNEIPGAPTDGSCSIFHANGGGVKKCGSLATCSTSELAALAIGQQCGGQVYAGQSLDGNKRMYTTSADSPDLTWSDLMGGGNFTTTNIVDDVTGMANSVALLSLDADNGRPGIQQHPAAAFCRAMNYSGKTDWYLPARWEMSTMFDNRSAIGNFSSSGAYWTSTESNGWGCCAMAQDFGSGNFGSINKHFTGKVRCVRKQ